MKNFKNVNLDCLNYVLAYSANTRVIDFKEHLEESLYNMK